jgi:hypothetical protein
MMGTYEASGRSDAFGGVFGIADDCSRVYADFLIELAVVAPQSDSSIGLTRRLVDESEVILVRCQ